MPRTLSQLFFALPRALCLGVVTCGFLAGSLPSARGATTGWNQSTGAWTYTDPTNWVNGVVNDQFDQSLQIYNELDLRFPQSYTFANGFTLKHSPRGQPLYVIPYSAGVTLTLGGNLRFNPQGTSTLYFGSAYNFGVDLGGATRTVDVSGSSSVFLPSESTVSNGGLIKTGTGSLTLNGTGTFAGGISLQGGTLQGVNANSLGSGTVTVAAAGTTLQLNATYPNNLALNATPVFRGGGGFSGTTNLGGVTRTMTVGGTGDYSAGVDFNGEVKNGSLNLSGLATQSYLSLRSANPTLINTSVTKVAVTIRNAGALGSGTVDLNTGSSLRLESLVDGDLSGVNAVKNAIRINSDVGLAAFGVNILPELAGTVALGNATRTLTNNSNPLLISGQISGTNGAGVVIAGGRLDFSGANTFTGGVMVGGTGATAEFGIGRKDAAGSGKITLNAGTLWITGSGLTGTNAVPNLLAVNTSATFVNPNTARVELSGALSLRGNLLLGGDLTLSGAMDLGSSTFSLSAQGNKDILSGPISGAAGLNLSTSGTEVVVSGNDTFAGGLGFSGNTLTLGHKSALGTGALRINGSYSSLGNSVSLTGAGAIANTITVNNDFTIAPALPLEFSGVIDLVNALRTLTSSYLGATPIPILLSGEVRGSGSSGALTLTGKGIFTLSGAST